MQSPVRNLRRPMQAALAAFCVTALLGAATAHAFTRHISNVVLQDVADEEETRISAQGTISFVSAQPDSDEFIFCGTGAWRARSGNPDETFAYAMCRAVNAEGRELLCFSEDPALVRVASSINAYSSVYFVARDGECISIQVNSGSPYAP